MDTLNVYFYAGTNSELFVSLSVGWLLISTSRFRSASLVLKHELIPGFSVVSSCSVIIFLFLI